MSERPRASSTSSLWLVVLGIGLTVGAAAALLSGVFTPPGAPTSSTVIEPANQLVIWVAEILPIAAIAFFVFYRLTREAMPVPTRLIAPVLIVILVLVVFVVLVRVNIISPNTPLSHQPIGLNANNTTGLPPGGNLTSLNLSGPGDTVSFFGLSLPTWVAVAILGGVVVTIGAVATLFVLRRSRPELMIRGGPSVDGVRSELESAARALDEGSGDPRRVLIELYGRLLHRLEPAVGDLATQTAEEIRTHYLIRLGVKPHTAEEITRLFERARYSSHPIGPGEVTRARTVLSDAIADLNSPREG